MHAVRRWGGGDEAGVGARSTRATMIHAIERER